MVHHCFSYYAHTYFDCFSIYFESLLSLGESIMAWGKDLSGRKLQVSNLISHGLTNQQIGDVLHISEPTVKTHLRNIYSKTDIHDRANLAIRVLNSDKNQS